MCEYTSTTIITEDVNNIYNLLGMAEDYILKNTRWRSEIKGIRPINTETPPSH